MYTPKPFFLASILAFKAAADLMPFESNQLTATDIESFPDIAYGTTYANGSGQDGPPCRAFPGSDDWPTVDEWSRFNQSLNGALLQPVPVGAVCYPGPKYDETKCNFLLGMAGFTRFYLDDPLTVLTEWPTGSTCLPALHPSGNCTLGGMPSYVVNATTVKHIQAAVNFARNKNIRLVIKNTGHDFGGRSTGAGALSVWTHNMKDFRYLPEYTMGQYAGPAVQFAAGTESWELSNRMAEHEIAVVSPSWATVGAAGGWLGGGGHSSITGLHGLGADQALSINVVTADGELVTADPRTNADLFFALRGGGAGTYGVVTSVVFKAHPPVNITSTSLSFSFSPDPPPPSNATVGNGNFTVPPAYYVGDVETFWRGASLYYLFAKRVVEAGGMGFSYIYPLGNGTYSFIGLSTMPGKTPQEVFEFMGPLYDDLNAAGIRIPNPRPGFSYPWGGRASGVVGDVPNNTRYTSRLFPRTHWEDPELFQKSMAAVRAAVDAGYVFHGTLIGPSLEVAGWPGTDSAVNPAWRAAVLHAMLFYKPTTSVQTGPEAAASEADINRYVGAWRALTPGSGAYINEADPAEPDWQRSFFGVHYDRLLRVKRARDPWGLFWALTTVGSEGWEVRTEDGYPHSENGRLCRVG